MNKKVNLLIASLTILLLSACVENVFKNNERNITVDQGVENLISTTTYKVEVRKGYTTNVTYKGQLIASTSKPMTILIPKSPAGTRALNTDLQVSFRTGESAKSQSKLWQTILFEDSKKGDFDYNDLIFRAKYTYSDDKAQVSIHPIALGSTKDIKLGLHWKQGSQEGKIIVADNCRSDLFGNRNGFINTHLYDVHFDSFVKHIDIPTSGVAEPINIWWFIEVDKSTTIYAVNDMGKQCLDDNGKPFGFAITDARDAISNPAPLAKKPADNLDDSAWNDDIVPDTPAWAHMPQQPTIPDNAQSMGQYESWEKEIPLHLEAGKTFNQPLNFVKDFCLFVEGELTLNASSYGNSKDATIIVMPGGKLHIPSRVDGVNIINFGTITMGTKVILSQTTIQTLTLDVPQTKVSTEKDSHLYVQGATHLNYLSTTNGNTEHYFGSLTVNEELYQTNNTNITVLDELITKKLRMDSNSKLYVGCQLHVSSDIYATNSVVISVKGNITAQTIECTSHASFNIMSGAVLSCETFRSSNISSTSINVFGSQYAAVIINTLDVTGGLNMEKSFTGNMYLNFNSFQEGGQEVDMNSNRLKLPGAPVLINSSEATVDASECSPGIGGNGAETMGWFAYPRENVHISSCYNFDSWISGQFDFILLPGANVFDINDTHPKEGEKTSIYQMN